MNDDLKIPTYQNAIPMRLVRTAAEILCGPGEKVVWRDAFRWKDENGVIPNHYEMFDIQGLAAEFDFEVVHDFHHVAVIKPRSQSNPGGNDGRG